MSAPYSDPLRIKNRPMRLSRISEPRRFKSVGEVGWRHNRRSATLANSADRRYRRFRLNFQRLIRAVMVFRLVAEEIPYHTENCFDFPRFGNLTGVVAHHPTATVVKADDTQTFAHRKPPTDFGHHSMRIFFPSSLMVENPFSSRISRILAPIAGTSTRTV